MANGDLVAAMLRTTYVLASAFKKLEHAIDEVPLRAFADLLALDPYSRRV